MTASGRHSTLGQFGILVGLATSIAGGVVMAQGASPAAQKTDGEAIYRDKCARCHETGVPRAVNRAALGRLSADNIRFALTDGAMRTQAAGLTGAQRDALIEWLSSETGPAASGAVGNTCPASEPVARPLDRPHWNGWGVDLAQRRFQPAAMAGLTAAQVPALKLKWAFGFPGVNQAYAQPTVVGGRIFVGSAGRKVYSLDAATGCEYLVDRHGRPGSRGRHDRRERP